MRNSLIEEMIKEVHGPRGGPEELLNGIPVNEYITGVIIPKQFDRKTCNNPDSESVASVSDSANAEDDFSEDNFPSVIESIVDARMRAKSFGISFMVEIEDFVQNPSLSICVTFGLYQKNEKGWQRKPFSKKFKNLELNEKETRLTIYRGDQLNITLYIKKIEINKNLKNIFVSVINESDISESKCNDEILSKLSIFQPSIRIKMSDRIKLTTLRPDYSRYKNDIIPYLYRNKNVLARGHMCSAVWKDVDYSEFLSQDVIWPDGKFSDECDDFWNPDVRSDFVPLFPFPAPKFDWDQQYGQQPELSAEKLSEMWQKDEIESYLSPLVNSYQKWISYNENELKNSGKDDREIIAEIIELQKKFLERIKRGIDLIKNNENVRLSFCFANRTILMQYRWQNEQKKKGDKNKETSREDFKWRPFQLAFILSVLESIVDENSEYRDILDLIWIPTGGGKTEAYLGLIAFAISFRRLTKSEKFSSGGTAVIMRYTLRLLTVQQFRRILRLITAAEYLRVFPTDKGIGWRPKNCTISGDLIYGSIRFSIGLWVGSSLTPNQLRGNKGAIDALSGKDKEGDPAQVIRCPVCGTILSMPDGYLPDEERLYITAKKTITKDNIKNILLSDPEIKKDLNNLDIKERMEYVTLIFEFNNTKKSKEIEDLWIKIKDKTGLELLPFSVTNPGYFPFDAEPGRKKGMSGDFEIYCPNPDCKLNQINEYVEGVPITENEKETVRLQDGLFKKICIDPLKRSSIPIPAYTVDEQIYRKCPTVIVSTADKFARLAFEPLAASIFGNVEKYNIYYGYFRDNLLENMDTTKKAKDEKNTVNVKPFWPPDLIIQDELHLIEGPLGSMYGLYENVVDGLINISGVKPKYIASSATIRKADMQVNLLYSRKLFQFPPFGITIDDNFFVRFPEFKDAWNENLPGRVYIGIYSPGMGPITPLVRIFSRILHSVYLLRNDDRAKYFWTMVGYFNSIRELGGAYSIYKEDVKERLKQLKSGRELDMLKIIELSSRIRSTEVPGILEKLENGINLELQYNPDALFTTSMFGTGVDIPHLSLMVVDGQPKTTTQYIQATGRVGRSHGGLVITFLRAGRPRDLSHYEMFLSYHYRIYTEVEPPSVSPLADGCLERSSGPALVSFLRNMPNSKIKWLSQDASLILHNDDAEEDFNKFIDIFSRRTEKILQKNQKRLHKVITYFKSQFDHWKKIAEECPQDLHFAEPTYTYKKNFKLKYCVVLGDPYHEKENKKVVYHNSPQSLRDVEETIGLGVIK